MLEFYTIINEITQELEILPNFFFSEGKEEVNPSTPRPGDRGLTSA
jgi:hypothetical protein